MFQGSESKRLKPLRRGKYTRPVPDGVTGYRRDGPRVPGVKNTAVLTTRQFFPIRLSFDASDQIREGPLLFKPILRFAIPTMPWGHREFTDAWSQFLAVGNGVDFWGVQLCSGFYAGPTAEEESLAKQYTAVRVRSMSVRAHVSNGQTATWTTAYVPQVNPRPMQLLSSWDPFDDQGYLVPKLGVRTPNVIPPTTIVARNLPYMKEHNYFPPTNLNGLGGAQPYGEQHDMKLFSRTFPFVQPKAHVPGGDDSVMAGEPDLRIAKGVAGYATAYDLMRDSTTCKGRLFCHIFQRLAGTTTNWTDIFVGVGSQAPVLGVQVESVYELSEPVLSTGGDPPTPPAR